MPLNCLARLFCVRLTACAPRLLPLKQMTGSNRSNATDLEARAKVVSTVVDVEEDGVSTAVAEARAVEVEEVVTTTDVAAESHPHKLPPHVPTGRK